IPVRPLDQAIRTGSSMTVEVIAHLNFAVQDLEDGSLIMDSPIDRGAIKIAVLANAEAAFRENASVGGQYCPYEHVSLSINAVNRTPAPAGPPSSIVAISKAGGK